MTDRSPDLRSQTMAKLCNALAAEYGEGHPLCRARTMVEFCAAVVAELGEQHPISRFVKGWPTVEDAKVSMAIGLRAFHLRQVEDGGLSGMVAGLEGALSYLHASLPPSDHDLLLPLKHLFFALRDLEGTGQKARCFRVKRRGPRHSSQIAELRARALAISDLIMAHKACSRDQADIEAARKISRRAKTLGVATRKEDLENWRRNTRGRRRQGGSHDDRSTTYRNTIHHLPAGIAAIHYRPGPVSLDQRVAAIHREINERVAPMFGTREQLDLDGLLGFLA